MPSKLVRLKKEARDCATFREHKMGQFHKSHYWDTVFYAYCVHCGVDAVVNTKPQANGIDICGSAVAVNCIAANKENK
jgi:hypothetical protein